MVMSEKDRTRGLEQLVEIEQHSSPCCIGLTVGEVDL